MNIAIEDVKFLERKYGEKPANGMVWKLAKAGLTIWEIDDIMKKKKENKID